MQAFLSSKAVALALLALGVPALAAVAGGCAEDSGVTGGTTTSPAASTTATPAAVRRTVFFPTNDVQRLVKVVVTTGSEGDGLAAAIRALAAGTDRPDLSDALPAGTRVLGASVQGGTAHIDLSAEFASGYPSGGSAAEIAVLAPIVYTATENADADAVLVTVEGAVPDVPTQFDLSVPLRRDDFPAGLAGGAP